MPREDEFAEQRAYQREKLSAAIRGLLPARPPAQDLMIAMHEARLAFGHAPPPPKAMQAWQTLQTLMGGEGSMKARAEKLSDIEVIMFVRALWDLYEAVSRATYDTH
jgi:hypothetical protein